MKLHSNKPIENFDNNDDFGVNEKVKQIVSFIDSYYSEFKDENTENKIIPAIENPMIVLYGGWGTGKTSVMLNIKNRLAGKVFKTVFFNAWEYEKDGDLLLSLFDNISIKLKDELIEFDKLGFNVKTDIINFIKRIHLNSISFKSKTIEVLGVGAGISLGLKKQETSFYELLSDFKEKMMIFENKLLSKPNEKLIVFIDDLDRCEPENILNLLSSIKLFFTYTKRTLYFLGIDKEAIRKSVMLKYGDIIKSDEYLEKIFDISFNMPQEFSLKTLVNKNFSDNNDNIKIHITSFLESINFKNPRHLKKLFNKYKILKYIKYNELYGHKYILMQNNSISIILTLYFMIIFEFYYKDFIELKNYELRIENFYKSILKNKFSNSTKNRRKIKFFDYSRAKMNILKENNRFPIFFIPYFDSNKIIFEIKSQEFEFINFISSLELIEKNHILVLFSKYLYRNFSTIVNKGFEQDNNNPKEIKGKEEKLDELNGLRFYRNYTFMNLFKMLDIVM